MSWSSLSSVAVCCVIVLVASFSRFEVSVFFFSRFLLVLNLLALACPVHRSPKTFPKLCVNEFDCVSTCRCWQCWKLGCELLFLEWLDKMQLINEFLPNVHFSLVLYSFLQISKTLLPPYCLLPSKHNPLAPLLSMSILGQIRVPFHIYSI